MTYRSVLRLGQEEVEDRCLHSAPNNKDDISLPADRFQGDGPSELVEQTTSVNSQGGKGHALCTHFEGEDLDGIQSLQRRETNRVDCTEDEDTGNGGFGCRGVCVIRLIG